MAAIGFIYAWQKLYPVLVFRSVVGGINCIMSVAIETPGGKRILNGFY